MENNNHAEGETLTIERPPISSDSVIGQYVLESSLLRDLGPENILRRGYTPITERVPDFTSEYLSSDRVNVHSYGSMASEASEAPDISTLSNTQTLNFSHELAGDTSEVGTRLERMMREMSIDNTLNDKLEIQQDTISELESDLEDANKEIKDIRLQLENITNSIKLLMEV